jgi:hypothetical protein
MGYTKRLEIVTPMEVSNYEARKIHEDAQEIKKKYGLGFKTLYSTLK